jgi:hypothetical protein
MRAKVLVDEWRPVVGSIAVEDEPVGVSAERQET